MKRDFDPEIDCFNTKEIVCPHCGYVYLDSYEFPDEISIVNCDSCEKEFEYVRTIDVTYETRPVITEVYFEGFLETDKPDITLTVIVKEDEEFYYVETIDECNGLKDHKLEKSKCTPFPEITEGCDEYKIVRVWLVEHNIFPVRHRLL